ncbi:MAG: hypothetical protein H7Z42_13495 [Roseiflexaceae bacterium]|nr:hypothetical protein [Roseiflexaceae bacterium]
MNESIWQVLGVLGAVALACVVIALIGLTLLVRSIRRLEVPHDTDFFTTMRLIPLALVVLLDMLDFGMDVFAAPLVWLFLDRMGLQSLRNKAVIESLIPFSGPIPTFTLAWIAARTLHLGEHEMRMVKQLSHDKRGTIIDV